MKRLLFVLLFPAFLAAQSTDVPLGVRLTPPANVPATVLDRFRSEFPRASAQWQRNGESDWAATFTDDSTQLPRVVIYDKSGAPLGGRRQAAKDAYPKSIDEYFHTNHPTDQYMVWRTDRADGVRSWFVIRKTDTTWFHHDGAYDRQKNARRTGTNAGARDAEIVSTLWQTNQLRLAVLKVAEKNGFVTETRLKQSEKMDDALRKVAEQLEIPLVYKPDEGEQKRIRSFSEMHGDRLAKSVNHELQRCSAQISRNLSRAADSDNTAVKELAEQFGQE